MADPELRIYVGPDDDPRITEAVRRGGGVVSDSESAQAIIWLGRPEELRPKLHPGVHWVQLPSAGIEQWMQGSLLDDERIWTSAAGAYAHSVAEHALALVLAGSHRLHECARATTWTPALAGSRLARATVTIVGAGGIGLALIDLLKPLGVHIIAVTRSGRAISGIEAAAFGELGAIWPRSDIVVLAAPLTPETRGLLDSDVFRALPEHAWVINVGRGAIVDHSALVVALQQRWIAGAALDVTDPEPLPDDHPLWREPRALITPHVANPPDVLRNALAERIEENVRRFKRGDTLLGLALRARGY